MDSTNFVLFRKDQILDVLKGFGFGIQKITKRKKIVTSNGEAVHCYNCNTTLTTQRVGTIAPGSKLLFCDKPACFATWVAIKKIQ